MPPVILSAAGRQAAAAQDMKQQRRTVARGARHGGQCEEDGGCGGHIAAQSHCLRPGLERLKPGGVACKLRGSLCCSTRPQPGHCH